MARRAVNLHGCALPTAPPSCGDSAGPSRCVPLKSYAAGYPWVRNSYGSGVPLRNPSARSSYSGQTGRLSKTRFVLRSERGRVPYGIMSTAQETIRFRLISDVTMRATDAVSAPAAAAARSTLTVM